MSNALRIISKEELHQTVVEENEKAIVGELLSASPVIDKSMKSLKEQMRKALDQAQSYQEADVKVEIDLTGFLPATVKRVAAAFQKEGWCTYYGEEASLIVVKPY